MGKPCTYSSCSQSHLRCSALGLHQGWTTDCHLPSKAPPKKPGTFRSSLKLRPGLSASAFLAARSACSSLTLQHGAGVGRCANANHSNMPLQFRPSEKHSSGHGEKRPIQTQHPSSDTSGSIRNSCGMTLKSGFRASSSASPPTRPGRQKQSEERLAPLS